MVCSMRYLGLRVRSETRSSNYIMHCFNSVKYTSTGFRKDLKMKILQVHVEYSTSKTSGENSTVDLIRSYLASAHIVDSFSFKVQGSSRAVVFFLKLQLKNLLSLFQLYRTAIKYDLILFHNQVPYIPMVLVSLISRRVAVVKVWHNVRPFCIKGSAFRDGQICWDCSKKTKFESIKNSCYRGSRSQTMLALISQSGSIKTLKSEKITNVAVSNYLRGVLLDKGFSANRVYSIQNAASNYFYKSRQGSDLIYLGRIVEEKGVNQLLSAWSKLQGSTTRKLHLVGDGNSLIDLKSTFENNQTVFHGHLSSVEIEGVIAQCGIAVIPNLWDEPFGKVALDFLTTKMVIVASFNGGIREILETDSGTIEIVESSANGIAQALESAMSNNVEVSVEKRKAVLENFNEEAIGKKWRTLIADIVKIA